MFTDYTGSRYNMRNRGCRADVKVKLRNIYLRPNDSFSYPETGLRLEGNLRVISLLLQIRLQQLQNHKVSVLLR